MSAPVPVYHHLRSGQVEDADRVVFPGVGAIRDCMTEIQRLKVGEVVSKAIKTKPVLAICVGMQALMEQQ